MLFAASRAGLDAAEVVEVPRPLDEVAQIDQPQAADTVVRVAFW